MKNKHLLLTLLLALFVPWAANAQTTGCEAIGETSTNWGAGGYSGAGFVPVDIYYNYSYEQMVYDGSEMPTTITSISFKYKSSYSMTEKDDVDIYLGETTTATLSGWMSADDLTLVYSGALNFPASTNGEWVEFEFNQNEGSFSHDQSKYIVVVINDKSYGYPSNYSSMYFCYETCGSGAHKYVRRDSGGEYTVPPTTTASNASQYPIVRFCGTFPVVCCPKPKNLACTGYTATTATFTWTNGGEETQWLLEYAMDENFTNPTQVTVNQSELVNGEYTLDNNLTTDQQYYARIKAYCPSCDPNYSDWSNTCGFKPSNTHYAVIGTGQTASSSGCYGGIYTYNNYYAYTQQIYTATELTAAGAIPGVVQEIALKFAESTDCKLTFEVYLGQTTGTSLSSAWISDADLTKVYEGETTFSGEGEWNSIDVTSITEWEWDGTSNIVVAIRRTDNSTPAVYYPDFYYTSSTNMCRYCTNSSSNVALNDFNVPTVSGSTTNQRVNMQFGIAPNPTPKPKNLHVVDNTLSSTGATLAWDAPSSATPSSYLYNFKKTTDAYWGAEGTVTEGTSVALTLDASSQYQFRVKADYGTTGQSGYIETTFTTLDDCAFPTNLTATTTPGQGTKATLTWVKGYDETAWVLEYATNNTFTEGLVEVTDGFTVEGNNVTANLTGLTAETHYYARVKANCDGPTSSPSNVAEFTTTNYVDYTFGQAATYTSYFVPIYGSYVGSSPLLSQFIIPSSELEDMAGGTIRRMTFHSSTASANWGTAEFSVYVKEVDATSFASSSASGLEDWSSMTNVYNGSLSISGNQMVIEFENNFAYNGGNLMIGFNETTTGTGASASWYYVSGPSNSTLYAYYYYGASYSRGSYLPKVTFNYRPTTTPRPIITEPVATTDVTATIAWTKPSDNVTGYKYQYKLASATEWPTSWTDLNDANAVSVTVPGLTPNTEYNFQMKAVYGTEESYPSTTSFATSCPATTAVPYTYDFETAPKFNCWEVATGSSVTRVNASSYAHNSDWYMKFGGYQTNEIAMPSFNQPANTLRLEYWVRPESYSNSSCGSFAIGYYNANNEFVALKTYAYNSTTSKYDGWESDTYKKEVIDFDVDANNDGTPDVPADANIVFRQFNTTSNWFWFVDDVKVKVIPTCEDVDNVHCVSFTNHSATIAWTADAVQDAWQIAYKAGANNFNPNNAEELATATIVDATTNPYLFDKNLEAGTTYYMYVRGNCGNVNGLGDWSDTYATFTTKAATPAPSNFVATNPASEKIDLVWTAGGGDFESWEIYYVASETTPEAPTATTTATVTDITTLPTTEAPYVLDELYPVTKYYAWIRAKHVWNSETTYSDWVALTSSFFETLDACPTPYDLEIANITSVSADFSWTGSTDVEDYVVEYAVEGTYSVNETEDFSGLTTAGYSAEGVLPEGWKRYNSNPGYMPHVSDASACGDINEFGTGNNYLLMTQNKKNSDQYLYAIMPQINNLVSFEFKYVYESTSYGVLSVGYVTNNTDYSTYQVLQTPTKSGTIATCKLTADNIATINANNGYVTFRYEGNYDTYYSVGIDDIVYKGGTYTPNPATQVEVDNAVQTTINGLTANTNYVARVKSVCTNAEWSSYINFTTLTEGKIVFTNASGDGLWSTAANWTPNAPAISDTAILRANAIIPNGTVATAKKITFEGATTPTLTINDGGQLQTDNTVTATVKKNITGYGTGLNAEGNPSGYYLIANPLNSSVYPSTTNGLVTTPAENYDLYQWSTSTSATYDEWRNFKASSFYLYNGTGYLYANVADVDLTFTGTVKANNTDAPMSLSFSTGGEFNGWNLKANPFVCNAYVKDATNGIAAFYRMNTAGDNFEAATGAIKPMEGIFVQATDESQSFKFTRTATSAAPGNLNINLAQAVTTRGEKGATDNAIIRFGEGNTLEKFSFRANSSKVYIPVEGKDYAVVNAGKTGEIPVSFKAEKNGSYSLSFTSQEVSFSYLHLIDNLTGNDVDLLANPSYSFDAQTTDYAQRFRLVFATGSSVDGDSFAFINGAGNLSIFGIEGTATVQVMDVLGHVLSSETFSGSYEKKLNVAPGVYMIRLINGNDVKVQKMIVK